MDFYMFLGPEPENVIQQYTQYVGRTFMPPYWALGFQISKYGYKDLDEMKAVLKRFQEHDIPLDTQVADIDHYEERKDFTIDEENWKELPAYFDYLHSIGMKTVMILDPALIVNETDYWPFETGKQENVFIKWPGDSPDFEDTNSTIMLGYVSASLVSLVLRFTDQVDQLVAVLAERKSRLSGLFQIIHPKVVDRVHRATLPEAQVRRPVDCE